MAIYYFASDGSWGDATDIILLDEDEYPLTDDQWDAVSNATDMERLGLVQQYKDEYDEGN